MRYEICVVGILTLYPGQGLSLLSQSAVTLPDGKVPFLLKNTYNIPSSAEMKQKPF